MNNHGDHHTKLTTNLATGSGAGGGIVVDVEKIGPFVGSGGLVNLSEKLRQISNEERFAPYARAIGKGADGDMYASLSTLVLALCTTALMCSKKPALM